MIDTIQELHKKNKTKLKMSYCKEKLRIFKKKLSLIIKKMT